MSALQLDQYKHLTHGGDFSLNLSQDEACVILKAYDYGTTNLTVDERQILDQIIGKLKDQIWP